nr:hypothetical protein [Scytonema sp. UIC 10036]
MQLNRVYDSTLLSRSKTYSIEGILYRYLYCTDKIKAPKYVFSPLAGQRRTADLELNRLKLYTRVYEVQGMSTNRNTTVTSDAVQMSLF